MSADLLDFPVGGSESSLCPDCGREYLSGSCPLCTLAYARRRAPLSPLGGSLPIAELKQALPHLKRLSLLQKSPKRTTYKARLVDDGRGVIVRVFRSDLIGSEDLFRFADSIAEAKCEVLTETLEIGEIGDLYYEILAKPPGNTLERLLNSGQLVIEELWRVAGMVDRHSFRLQFFGLPYPPPADSIYVAADGTVTALIGCSDLIGKSHSPTREFQIGDIIANKYLLEAKAGEGGSANVFEAEQLHPISRKVAVKLSKSVTIPSDAIHQFDIERCSLMRLDHPNIAKILDAGFAARGRPFLTMELICGGTPLTEYCNDTELKLGGRLRLFRAVCEVVNYAHDQGIFHRDLKPSNILVAPGISGNDPLPIFKILDFGISSSTVEPFGAQPWITRMATGTPGYMAPEQKSGLGDARADVFSLGCILGELLAGVRINQSSSDCPPTAATPASRFDRIIAKALDTDPAYRYSCPRDLVEALAIDALPLPE